MGRKRRQVGIQQSNRWIFNRMADVYEARPPYPFELIDHIFRLAPGSRVLDLAAGTGHTALPLAERGLSVTAVDAAQGMLDVLQRSARSRCVSLNVAHARAEDLPFADHSFDLVVIADALHFLDVELTAAQVRRVLVPHGALALVTCEFADTEYMRAVRRAMHAAAPRRPRSVSQAIPHLASLANVRLLEQACYRDDHAVTPDTLESILRSVSFIGPAMNPERFTAFKASLREIELPPVWSRSFTLYVGQRRRSA